MKILLLGPGGVLGTAFRQVATGHELFLAGREQLDIIKRGAVEALIMDAGPDIVVNCAAHTDLEGAEIAPDQAFAANSLLPGLLGAACRRHGILLVHFSSTGCYGAWSDEPYTEEDLTSPTTVHHRSKLSGERAIAATGCEHLVLRTGWLYGGGAGQPKNFVWKRLIEAKSHERIASDASQYGNPTYAPDLARQTFNLIDAGLRGTYNAVGRGKASRYEYVKEIVMLAQLPCKVEPGPAFNRRVTVSPNESAINYRLGLLGLDQMPDWKVSLKSYVSSLLSSREWLDIARLT